MHCSASTGRPAVSEAPARRSGRVTINDVAARAGVSRGAVSLAFNNRPGVSEATRVRIMAAVTELGWVPSQTAVKLSGSATGAADTVGLVIARPARQLGLEPFYMEFISGVESVLEEHRCSLLLHLVRDATQEIAVHREWWQARRIAGSILVDIQQNDPRVTELAAIGLPAVAVGHPSLTGGFTSVWTDDEAAVHEAVRYLAALGHRRIARVGGHPSLGHTIIRTAALNTIVAELGLEAGPQRHDRLLRGTGRPGDAVAAGLPEPPHGDRVRQRHHGGRGSVRRSRDGLDRPEGREPDRLGRLPVVPAHAPDPLSDEP